MGILSWLFGGRAAAQPRRQVKFDLRPDWEIKIANESQNSLGGEDEQYALQLLDLCKRFYARWKLCRSDADEALNRVRNDIRKVGEFLCANGGNTRMVRIVYRVAHLAQLGRVEGATRSMMEHHWQGICGWER